MRPASDRLAAELRQGALLARQDADRHWGWEGPAGRLRADRRAAFLIDHARLGSGVRCLELGTGTGAFTTRLVQSGCMLVGIELSPETAACCRERVGSAAEILVGNVETAEGLEGRVFDAIVGVSVLHHVDLEVTLASTFSLLRPGGRFAFSEPNIRNPQIWLERKVRWVSRRRRVLEHEGAFTARGLRNVFELAGFVVDVAEPFEFLHPSTPQRLMRGVQGVERLLERTLAREFAGSVRIAGRRA